MCWKFCWIQVNKTDSRFESFAYPVQGRMQFCHFLSWCYAHIGIPSWIPMCVCIASCNSIDKIGLKMTDQESKHVAYVNTLCNKVAVLTYIIQCYITFMSTSWCLCSNSVQHLWPCVCVCVCVCVILWLSVAAELRAGTGNVDHYKLRNPVQLKSFCLISERHMTCCSMSIVTSIDSVILSTTLLPQPRLI